jgi:hypothetical protein
MQSASNGHTAAPKPKVNAMVRAQQLRAPFGFWISCHKLLPNSYAMGLERRK